MFLPPRRVGGHIEYRGVKLDCNIECRKAICIGSNIDKHIVPREVNTAKPVRQSQAITSVTSKSVRDRILANQWNIRKMLHKEVELEDIGVKQVRAVLDALVDYVYVLLVQGRDKDIVFVRKPDFEITRAAREPQSKFGRGDINAKVDVADYASAIERAEPVCCDLVLQLLFAERRRICACLRHVYVL